MFLGQLWQKGREKPWPGLSLPATSFPWWGWLGLTGTGVYPNLFFSLLWVSPGLILLSLQVLRGERHVLSAISQGGDWSLAVSSAVAAFICGWFWEMWNYYSLAKWHYNIPYVNRFHIFEMPLLGYASYLTLGLECAVIAGLLVNDDSNCCIVIGAST